MLRPMLPARVAGNKGGHAVLIGFASMALGTSLALSVPPAEAQPRTAIANQSLPPGVLACLKPAQISAGQGGAGLLAFSRNGERLATAGSRIHLWDIATGKELQHFPTNDYALAALAFTSQGKLLALGRFLNKIRLWEVHSGKDLYHFAGHERGLGAYRGQDVYVVALALAPDCRRVAAAMSDWTIRIWDVTREAPCRALVGHRGWAFPFAFSPDSRLLASNSHDEQPIRLWDVAAGTERWRSAREATPPCELAFSPDGRILASGLLDDHSICLWEVATGKELRRLRGHESWALRVAFSADGRLLTSVGEDRTIRLWEVASGGAVYCWKGPQWPTGQIAFSPDGRIVASACRDGTVLWDVATPAGKRDGPGGPLTAPELKRLWETLADGGAAEAHAAIWALVAAPEQSVSFLRQSLRPVGEVAAPLLRSWIAGLDSDRYAEREMAQVQLQRYADAAESFLRQARDGKKLSLEARRRIEKLLAGSAEESPTVLRLERAVAVLEHVATSEARQVLGELSRGAPQARLTRLAQAALERLANRCKGK